MPYVIPVSYDHYTYLTHYMALLLFCRAIHTNLYARFKYSGEVNSV
jgi:hypothetical protein